MPSDLSILKSQLAKYISTLHETSCDNSDNSNIVHLCDSNVKVYDFDNITQDLFPSKTSSFDALYFIGNEVYCIEFKNSHRKQLNKKEKKEKIQEKYVQGLNSLSKIFKDNNISIKNHKFYYFVIYKDTEKQRGREYVEEVERQNQIKFGLKEAKEANKEKQIFKNSHIKTTCKSCFKKEYRKIFVDLRDSFPHLP